MPPAEAATLDGRSPYLKAHLHDGSVYVLTAWQVDSTDVRGSGQLLDPNRRILSEGPVQLPLDSVALFETNVLQRAGATQALMIMAGVTAAVTAFCLTDTKACFGSCPTFYAPDSSGAEVLQAEGFSASIAPALEAVDIDMLYRFRPTAPDLAIRVTNEALETHVIRHADLLAVPRPEAGRVFVAEDGAFHRVTGITAPVTCLARDGDCANAVHAFDGLEWYSLTDSADLAAREIIELVFPMPATARQLGIVVSSRQTLLTTFLIYQGLAYLGRDAGAWLARLQRADGAALERVAGIGRELGRIDVLVAQGEHGWVLAGSVGETGPLATDTKIVPLPEVEGGPLRVRLRLTKGLWRVDYVAAGVIEGRGEPQRIGPHAVTREGAEAPGALASLLDPERTLVTLPGDVYELSYMLPASPERYEYFLDSRGYYLEWLREEWLAEENALRAAQLFLDPAGALRTLAPLFKAREAGMEEVFWGSRYVRN